MHGNGRSRSGKLWIAVVLLLAVALLAACGSKSEGSSPGTPPVPGGTSAAQTGAAGGVTNTTSSGAGATGAVTNTTGSGTGATTSATNTTTNTTTSTTGAAQPTTAATSAVTSTNSVSNTTAVTSTGTTTGTAASGAKANVPPGTVRVAVVRGAMIDTMRKLAQKYEQENPGAKVQVEEEPEGGAFEALIAAGNQPDIIVASFGSQIGRLAAAQSAVPLEDMDGAQQILSSVDKVTAQKLYGHNYYIPVGADVTVMIYNKDLFKEAGLDPNKPPQTWDEFLADAQKIQGLPARQGGAKTYGTVFWNDALTWGGWYWNMLQPIYLNANGGQCQLLNRLGTDIVFDQPKCGMDKFYDFTAKAQKFAPPTMEKNFFSRSIGMWPQYGYSWEPNLKQAQGKPMVIGQDVAVAPVPVPKAGDKSFTTYGGRGLMILKTTPDRQQKAWGFVKFLMQPENNTVFLKELGYLPTLTSLRNDPYFQDPARKPFVDALQTAVMPEQFKAADDVANAVLGVYQQAVVQGSMKPADAVKAAADQARAALKKSQ